MLKWKFKTAFAIVFCLLLMIALFNLQGLNSETAVIRASQSDVIDSQSISSEKRPIFNEKIYSNATLEEDFCDNSIIVVLDENVSSFSASRSSRSINSMFDDIGAKAIKDLSALPENYLTVDGKIDTKNANARALAEHFEQVAFNQVLKIELGKSCKQNVLDTIKRVERIKGVVCAEPNRINVGTSYPKIENHWGLDKIQAHDAWNVTTGSSDVRVGIIDSGIASHDDLNPRIATGWDFFNRNADTADDIGGHGTHVAGIVAGIAQNVTLVPLQTAYDTSGTGSHNTDEVVEAIKHARNLWGTNQQISILNYSIIGFGTELGVLAEVQKFPGLFVWAAGNNGGNGINIDGLPNANLFRNIPNLISVGSTMDANDSYKFRDCQPLCIGGHLLCDWRQFNYGATTVDIFAPGHNINSTVPYSAHSSGYANKSGTSMSAPMVTGVAALIKSKYPDMPAYAIKLAIMGGVDKVPALSDRCVSGGRLNAYKALINAERYANGFAYHGVAWEGQFNAPNVTGRTVSGDFSGDGRDDIAVMYDCGNLKTEIHVWLGDASKTFTYSGIWWTDIGAINATALTGRIVAGDFNGDGKDDIAAMWHGGGLYTQLLVWKSTGTSFSYLSEWWENFDSISPPALNNRIVAGDFNGDGKTDIAAMWSGGGQITQLLVWKSTGTSFSYQGDWWEDFDAVNAVALTGRIVAGDFNGDGKTDIAAMWSGGGQYTQLLVWTSTGTGFSYRGYWWEDFDSVNAVALTGRIVAGDFNGDGKADIAAMWTGGGQITQLLVWTSTGTSFSYQGFWWEDTEAVTAPNLNYRIVAGDFDGNGLSDISAIWFDGYSTSQILLWS